MPARNLVSKSQTAFTIIRKLRNWPLFFYDALRPVTPPPHRLFHYRFRDGSIMAVRAFTADKWALPEVFLKNPYSHPKFHALGEAPIIVDAGAHLGSFAVPTARALPHARVFSFEPAQATYDLLCQNIKLNNLTNVTAIQAALTPLAGQAVLYSNPTWSSVSSLIPAVNNRDIRETVPAWTLEKLLKTYGLPQIDFLKCDIQGSELELLWTLPAETWQRIRNISLEYHLFDPRYTLNDLFQALAHHNFETLEHTRVRDDLGLLKARAGAAQKA